MGMGKIKVRKFYDSRCLSQGANYWVLSKGALKFVSELSCTKKIVIIVTFLYKNKQGIQDK